MSPWLGVVGLGMLVWGAEHLVRGATAVSESMGVPPLVIGLTVLAFGTSAPEAAVGVYAAKSGAGALAIGNVVGSNIFNVLLILGVAAALRPLRVTREVIYRQVPLMIGVSVFACLLVWDRELSRLDGSFLLFGLGLFTLFQWRHERGGEVAVEPMAPAKRFQPYLSESTGKGLARVALGLILLVMGSRWLVGGALTAAASLGVPPVVAGLTIVAVGTSLPELLTSAVASIRGRTDLAVGNVLGSNVFNLLFVLGAVGVVAPEPVRVPENVVLFDGPVMLATALACFPAFWSGHRLPRWKGFVFLGYALCYLMAVYLRAIGEATPDIVLWVGLTISGSLITLTAVGMLAQRPKMSRN